VPAVATVAFALLGIEGASTECENPFSGARTNHLGMDKYCVGSQDEVAEMLQWWASSVQQGEGEEEEVEEEGEGEGEGEEEEEKEEEEEEEQVSVPNSPPHIQTFLISRVPPRRPTEQ